MSVTPQSSGKSAHRPVLSLVTPAFNEAANLEALYGRLASVMGGADLSWEWVVVDDHSSDRTYDVLCQLAERDKRVSGIRLVRNVGSHAAILCGLAHAQGDAAIVLAADGEDPPEEIPRLIAAWQSGASVVWAERQGRSGRPAHEELAGRFSHWLMRRWSGLKISRLPAATSFWYPVRRWTRSIRSASAIPT